MMEKYHNLSFLNSLFSSVPLSFFILQLFHSWKHYLSNKWGFLGWRFDKLLMSDLFLFSSCQMLLTPSWNQFYNTVYCLVELVSLNKLLVSYLRHILMRSDLTVTFRASIQSVHLLELTSSAQLGVSLVCPITLYRWLQKNPGCSVEITRSMKRRSQGSKCLRKKEIYLHLVCAVKWNSNLQETLFSFINYSTDPIVMKISSLAAGIFLSTTLTAQSDSLIPLIICSVTVIRLLAQHFCYYLSSGSFWML